MATLVDLTEQYGIENAETSLEVKTVTVRVAPEFKQFQQDRTNNKKGFAVGSPEAQITLQGEITATTGGFWDWTFSTACTVANDYQYNGAAATGDVFLDEITYTQEHSGFKSVNASLSVNLLIDI